MNEEVVIPFQPRDEDIVATKIRTWNANHAGNKFYTLCIQKAVDTFELDAAIEFREASEEIYHLLTKVRGGRFLKLPEGETEPETCTVMSRRDGVSKIIQALKTAKSRKDLRAAGIIPPPFVKAAQTGMRPFKVSKKKESKPKLDVVAMDQSSNSPSTSVEPAASNSNKCSSPSVNRATPCKQHRISYVAVSGKDDQPIHPYALQLISFVCSQSGSPSKAHRVLDQPSFGFTIETEPDRERLLRLQLRQRFVSALAIGMTPIEFARKLLKLWGGHLIQDVQVVEPNNTPIDMDTPANATATFPQSTSPAAVVPVENDNSLDNESATMDVTECGLLTPTGNRNCLRTEEDFAPATATTTGLSMEVEASTTSHEATSTTVTAVSIKKPPPSSPQENTPECPKNLTTSNEPTSTTATTVSIEKRLPSFSPENPQKLITRNEPTSTNATTVSIEKPLPSSPPIEVNPESPRKLTTSNERTSTTATSMSIEKLPPPPPTPESPMMKLTSTNESTSTATPTVSVEKPPPPPSSPKEHTRESPKKFATMITI